MASKADKTTTMKIFLKSNLCCVCIKIMAEGTQGEFRMNSEELDLKERNGLMSLLREHIMYMCGE